MNPKISSGYFYNVYDLGDDRVLKKKRSFAEIAKSVKGNNQINFFKLIHKTFVYIKQVKQNTNIIKEKLSILPRELLGNPEFVNSTDYTQDKVVLIMDYFDTHTLEENSIIIEKYAALVLRLMEYGIHDFVYKFKNSYGVDKNGEVAFIDFNEVIFSKEKTLALVKSNHWRNEAQFRKFPEGPLKQHIDFVLSRTLTVEMVGERWGSEKM